MAEDDRLCFISNAICSLCQLKNDVSITNEASKSNDVIDFLDDQK